MNKVKMGMGMCGTMVWAVTWLRVTCIWAWAWAYTGMGIAVGLGDREMDMCMGMVTAWACGWA